MYLIPTQTHAKRQSYGGVSSSIADVGNSAKKASSRFTSSMSRGQIVGIVIAIFVILALAIASIWWCCVRSAKKRDSTKEEEEKKRIREISNTTTNASMSAFEETSPRKPQYWSEQHDYRMQRRESDADSIEDNWSQEPLQTNDNQRGVRQEQYTYPHDYLQQHRYAEPRYQHESQIYTSSHHR